MPGSTELWGHECWRCVDYLWTTRSGPRGVRTCCLLSVSKLWHRTTNTPEWRAFPRRADGFGSTSWVEDETQSDVTHMGDCTSVLEGLRPVSHMDLKLNLGAKCMTTTYLRSRHQIGLAGFIFQGRKLAA